MGFILLLIAFCLMAEGMAVEGMLVVVIYYLSRIVNK